jgi:hypothetical protein
MVSNPFQNPKTINEELDQQVRNEITEEFAKQGTLSFFGFMKMLEDTMTLYKNTNDSDERQKYHSLAQILGYYISNIIINNNSIADSEKQQLINGLVREVLCSDKDSDDEMIVNDIL